MLGSSLRFTKSWCGFLHKPLCRVSSFPVKPRMLTSTHSMSWKFSIQLSLKGKDVGVLAGGLSPDVCPSINASHRAAGAASSSMVATS
jgi:hypothetical protein